MTKLEELARDCIENHTHRLIDKPTKQDIYLREESIYIQGYKECERRDKKRIAELEEANNELKGKLVLNDMVLKDDTKRIKELEDKLMDKVCLESLDIVSGKIKQLEKENAELKSELSKVCGIKGCAKLTKAKEIIKKLLRLWNDVMTEETVKALIAEAEQFLSEVGNV